MDSTADKARPGSRTFDMKMRVDRLAESAKSATGENIGPERKTGPRSEDTLAGGGSTGGASTSEVRPPLRGKPKKGSRLDESV